DRWGGKGKWRAEDFLLREFRRRLHQYLPSESIPQSDLATLALMQHYGVPTRLLDMTRSPYVALYFAVRDAMKDADAAVWVFNMMNIRANSLRRVFAEDPALGEQIGNYYDPHAQFTKQEMFKKWFMPSMTYSHLERPESPRHHEIILDIEPFTMNPRLTIQQGLFLVSGSQLRTFEETLGDILQDIQSQIVDAGAREPSVSKIVIPGYMRRPLMRHLEKMNITAASLFAGLEGFATSLREKLTAMDRDDFLGYMLGMPT
ncbi:MAG: FRG domain-containing protein, partial [Chloroflexi bacterium]|nr:FRG domain-containing protein [Chloroflexota bacterium]